MNTNPTKKISMSHESENRDVITLNHGGAKERIVSTRFHGRGSLELFNPIAPPSREVVAQLVFGGCAFHEQACSSMGDWPVLWVQGDVCSGNHITGIQTFDMEGASLRRVTLNHRVVGSCWSDADADYCLLAGILPLDASASRSDQTRSCFEQIEAALEQAGMDFSHVVRTWFYLDKLLSWYGEFNAARTAFFESRGVFDRLLPASTGIGAGNPAGAALTAGVLAICPRSNRMRIEEIISPLQCAATEYRSSFSRAVEVALPERRQLLVSGTASIEPGGKTIFANDLGKQIHLTLDVVEAILKSRGMVWRHTTRAVGYFRDMAGLNVFDAYCRERGIPPLPMTPAHAAICRDDLLFELELDAVIQ